ncbi:MAG: pyridoxal phosphate-dependent aminotransferase [Acidobacteriota bacterium]
MFSSRLRWHEPSNPLANLVAKKRQQGATILDLTESNPTRAGFDYPEAQILSTLSDDRALLYQPSPRGRLDAREAVAEYYAQRGVKVDPSHILLTASTSEAYSYLFQLLADPGDEILSPRPSYPLFEYLAGLSSVNIRQYPLRYDGGWHIDVEALERIITPRSRAIVVVNPNNPTGSFLKRVELETLETIAERYKLAIISDEVFCDYAFHKDPQQVLTLAGERRALTFSMSGLSKVAGLPQMKLGWIVASGPDADRAMEGLELIADTFLSVATPVQVALPKLLESSATLRDQIRHRTQANLKHLSATFANTSATVLNVEGGWYAILQVPNTRSEQDWALSLLNEHDVLVQPGFYFDFDFEAFFVLSLLTKQEVLTEGVRTIYRSLHEFGT